MIHTGMPEAPILACRPLVTAPREAGDRLVAEHHKRQAAVERQGADGDGEGRQPQHGDEDAVDRSRNSAQDDAQGNDDFQRQAGAPQGSEDTADESRDAGHGQVDLPGEDDQGHWQGEQEDGDQVNEEEPGVAGRGEPRHRCRRGRDAEEDGDDDRRVPAAEEAKARGCVTDGRGPCCFSQHVCRVLSGGARCAGPGNGRGRWMPG
jgi:hypothetical protein